MAGGPTGELDNTMILVLSDNGGSALEHPNGQIGSTGAPWTTMRYVPIYTRDKRVVISGDVIGVEPGPENTYGGCGGGWANLSNTPFRMFKKFSHEGGVATPLIVHWPAKIKSKEGRQFTERAKRTGGNPQQARQGGPTRRVGR